MTKFSDFIRAPGTAGPPTRDGIYNLGFALRSEWPGVLANYVRVDAAQSFTAPQQAQGRANIGAVIGTDVQAFSPSLTSLAGLTTAADRLPYTTASNTWAVTTLTAFARTILDDTNAAAVRTTIGLGNVDNTSDVNKPISTATQAALNTRVDTAAAQSFTAPQQAQGRANIGAAALSSTNTFTAAQNWGRGAPIAAASTLTLGADGNSFVVTGSATINAISGSASPVTLVFTGTCPITQSAGISLPGGKSMIAFPGDTLVFVSNNAGEWRLVSYQPGAGGWVTLPTHSASNVPDMQFLDLSYFLQLRVSGSIRPVTDAVRPILQTSVNNGSTWEGGASDYTYQVIIGTGAAIAGASGFDASMRFGPADLSNASDFGFTMTLHNFNVTRTMVAETVWTATRTGGNFSGGTLHGLRNAATARNAIRIAFSNGNILVGAVTVEGMRG